MNSDCNTLNPLNFLTFQTEWIAEKEIRLAHLCALTPPGDLHESTWYNPGKTRKSHTLAPVFKYLL